ncbi:MAG: chromate efflux transporter [Pseudomonadota bacterium]
MAEEGSSTTGAEARPRLPSLAEASATWARIALLSFGGPAGQIALMQRILVDEKRWLGEQRFLHALNFCMLLPGPEAQQLCVYVGWLLNRTIGGLVAGVLFVLPGLLAILALSFVYALYGDVGMVEGLFAGLKSGVVAIVLQALVRIAGRALTSGASLAIAGLSFAAIFAFAVPFPVIILLAALFGYFGARSGLDPFGRARVAAASGAGDDASTALGAHLSPRDSEVRGTRRAALTCLALWLTPTATLLLVLGGENVFSQIAVFFSTMAVVTFGGAYAVLAYVAQEAVGSYGWLAPGEMLDGLGMAETTPGPLIIVTQFVGFMGALREASGLPPLLAATLGALLTTWVTFTPCFAWIFLGAPHMERLRSNAALAAALSAITAAVVGVISNLAVWFTLHVLFDRLDTFTGFGFALLVPELSSLNFPALLLVAGSLFAVFVLRAGLFAILGGTALAGMALNAFGLT